jgi:GNAT superfamily N-acetyltransferase
LSATKPEARREARIREATERDLVAVARVHLETVVPAYAGIFPPDAPAPTLDGLQPGWERILEAPRKTTFVAELAGEVVGTAVVCPAPDTDDIGELRRLHVLPAHWGHGIGSALHDLAVQTLAERFARAELWVLERNTRARAMYERRGWTLVPDRMLEWPGLSVVEVRYARELRA